MSSAADNIQHLFIERMTLVNEISALNAEQLKNTQLFSGGQFDIERCQEALEEQGTNEQLQNELAEAKTNQEQFLNRMNDCQEKIGNIEQKIASLDKKLEEL